MSYFVEFVLHNFGFASIFKRNSLLSMENENESHGFCLVKGEYNVVNESVAVSEVDENGMSVREKGGCCDGEEWGEGVGSVLDTTSEDMGVELLELGKGVAFLCNGCEKWLFSHVNIETLFCGGAFLGGFLLHFTTRSTCNISFKCIYVFKMDILHLMF